MNEFWHFLGENWALLLVALFFFGEGIAEFFGRGFSSLIVVLAERRKLTAENKDLRRQLKARGAELKRAHGLLATSRPALPDSDAHARMSLLLFRVQATDSAMPQLPLDLRQDIDTELTRQHTPKESD
ncbi:hypothetical protein [Amycolatopsis sp. DSM 110486]|uniref:hypothetical protein n=1 Tax=Amycolatopsis sp. DSM 110486 TaxID=2865832 RepID=UPI001C69A401|nr:hypothetical protein [Amycolatopsis sp. DSM 110486]QYN17510.1 hypothetical protein K1T34_32510 [Amycolatopsis sp. DSM 110486]